MKSITARFTALVVAAILLSVAIVGGVSMVTLRDKVDADAASEINLSCANEAQRINQTLFSIEQSVGLEAAVVLDGIDSTDRFFEDEPYRSSLTDQWKDLFIDVAEETAGAVTFYFRYNADDIASTQGFLFTRDGAEGQFEEIPLTDISLYSPDDDEHVGWYYIPIRKAEPTWLNPYQNKNLDIYMISYVIPVYSENRLVGVIGMDVDFSVIVDQLKEVHAYEGSGYAGLVGQDGTVYYHPQIEYGTHLDGSDTSLFDIELYLDGSDSAGVLIPYQYEGKEKELAYQGLINGMNLVLVADADEIEAERNELMRNMSIATLLIIVVFVAVALVSGRALTRPLRELTEVADEVSKGNLDVQIPRAEAAEVSTLIDAYTTTVDRMREQMAIIDKMAHTDALTELLNKSAYDEAAAEADASIAAGDASAFALVMVDVNDLKRINDSFGHERGDAYLLNSVKLIRGIFPDCDAYRIGGDEFVVIAKGDALVDLDGRLDDIAVAMQRLEAEWGSSDRKEPWEFPSLAYGAAVFDEARDGSVAEVFKRADEAMYAKKQEMKNT